MTWPSHADRGFLSGWGELLDQRNRTSGVRLEGDCGKE